MESRDGGSAGVDGERPDADASLWKAWLCLAALSLQATAPDGTRSKGRAKDEQSTVCHAPGTTLVPKAKLTVA
jgi:hypothetical protein